MLTPATPGSGKALKIGYISNKEDVPIVHVISVGIEAQAARSGAKLYFCDSAGSDAKALSCAQSFATEGVQGIINFQHDSAAAPSICKAGPNVPVIAVDISQKPCQSSFMGVDNAYGGYVAGLVLGSYFKQNFGCKYDAWISLEEPEAGATNSNRLGGYRKGFAKYCGTVHNIKTEAFDASAQQAHTIVTNLLGSLPGMHHIIAVSIDDEGIEGAFAAATQQGRAHDLYAAALGMADTTSRCAIKTNPNWVSDTAITPEKYGQVAVPWIIKAIKGQHLPPTLYMPLVAVTGSTITKLYPNLHC
jgi:ribose transport system substrate-binding protein